MRTFLAIMLCPLVVVLGVACGSSQRATALRTAYTTTAIAADSLVVLEHERTEKIIADGKSGDEVRANVAIWRARTDAVDAAVGLAFRAIAAAYALNDDASAAAVASPVRAVVDGLANLKTEGK